MPAAVNYANQKQTLAVITRVKLFGLRDAAAHALEFSHTVKYGFSWFPARNGARRRPRPARRTAALPQQFFSWLCLGRRAGSGNAPFLAALRDAE
jgi:hypothetical protein